MNQAKGNIERLSAENKYYRKVIYTDPQIQLVLMRLAPNREIPSEVHHGTTQFFRIESGSGSALVGHRQYRLGPGDFLIVPSNTRHRISAGPSGLVLYTIYSPPEHAPGTREW